LDARIGVDTKRISSRSTALVGILADAADAVAAHLPAASVGVVHLHAAIGDIGRANEDQPVTANARAPVADARRQRRRLAHVFIEAIDVDVVVADAVHLDERELAHLVSFSSCSGVERGGGVGPTSRTMVATFEGALTYPSIVEETTR